MHKLFITTLFTLFLSLPSSSNALNIEDKLENPALESRAYALFHDVRCVVCAGESIADSRADLAKDLRALIRDKIKEGRTDQQILDYIATGYGDSILMQPPLKQATYLLWFGPAIIFLVGFCTALFVNKRSVSKL